MKSAIENVLIKSQPDFHPVIAFDPAKEKLFQFDFSGSNPDITSEDIADTQKFSAYINRTLQEQQAKFGIGGYNEDRVLYKRSDLFSSIRLKTPANEPGLERVPFRSVHLGIDIWGTVGTPVFVPLGGMVHSVAFNNYFGDYGATIILQHQVNTIVFHTLYGHVGVANIARLHAGQYISRGELLAHFGKPEENGWWPPHLHFQVIGDMEFKEGDYPGVCTMAESEKYLQNCPNPDLILNMMQYVIPTANK